jgi:hypothetical protein
MFQASSCPSSGATTSAVAASGLPSELGDSSAIGRGRAGWPKRYHTHTHTHTHTHRSHIQSSLSNLFLFSGQCVRTIQPWNNSALSHTSWNSGKRQQKKGKSEYCAASGIL